eukprot:434750-Pyramimonas_sp.AAC.1
MIQWLLFVLSKMCIPRWAVEFFSDLCEDHAALAHFCGAVLARFSVGRGFRQGCLVSMPLFALSLDPARRWLNAASLLGFRLSGYADDSRFWLAKILTDLSPLFDGLSSSCGYRACVAHWEMHYPSGLPATCSEILSVASISGTRLRALLCSHAVQAPWDWRGPRCSPPLVSHAAG